MNTQPEQMADTSLTGPDPKALLTEITTAVAHIIARGDRIYTISIVPRSRHEWQATITYITSANRSRYIRVTDLADISLYPIQHLRTLLHRHGIAPFRTPGHGRPHCIREEEARRFLNLECPGIRIDLERYLVELNHVDAMPVAA